MQTTQAQPQGFKVQLIEYVHGVGPVLKKTETRRTLAKAEKLSLKLANSNVPTVHPNFGVNLVVVRPACGGRPCAGHKIWSDGIVAPLLKPFRA